MFEEESELTEGASGSPMFPFLSVLFCMLGALLMIMVIGSLRTTVKDNTITARLEAALVKRADLDQLTQALQETASMMSQLENATRQTSELELSFRQEDASLAELRRKGDEAQSRKGKLDLVRARHRTRVVHRTMITKREATAAELAEVEKRLDEAKGEVSRLTEERTNLTERSRSPELRVRARARAAGRTPVYLELLKTGVKVHTEGTPAPVGVEVPLAEAAAAGGLLEKLAVDLARPDSSRFAVLLVRPGALKAYRAATRSLRECRAPFVQEPVEGNWRIVFEEQTASVP